MCSYEHIQIRGTFLPFLVLRPGPRIWPTQSLGILSWLLVPDRNCLNTRRVLGRSYSTCEVSSVKGQGEQGGDLRWPKEDFLPTQSCCQNHGGNELSFFFALKHEIKLENEHFLTTQSWYTQAANLKLTKWRLCLKAMSNCFVVLGFSLFILDRKQLTKRKQVFSAWYRINVK